MQHPSTSLPCAEAHRILLVTTLRWPFAARLAVAFRALGCTVDVWCPRGHPIEAVATVQRRYRCRALFRASSLRKAIRSAGPDLVVPCDDEATRLLCQLHGACGPDEENGQLRDLIARSLGEPDVIERVSARLRLLETAREHGLRTPACSALESVADLEAWTAWQGFPTVLKIDHSCGGQGVLIVHDIQQARAAYRLAQNPSWSQSLRDLVLRRNPQPLTNRLAGKRPAISAHQFIRGMAASRTVACWKGRILAGISIIAVETDGATGPATVVQVSANAEMAHGAQRLMAVLGLSGLCGLDFVIEEDTGAAYLIEMNPRATPTSHLALGAGFDMPAALVAQLGGEARPEAASAPLHEHIAIFPGEWRRDPFSLHLKSAYHDVPWQEDALVQECIALPWEARGLAARIRDRLRRESRPPSAPFPFAESRDPITAARPGSRYAAARYTPGQAEDHGW